MIGAALLIPINVLGSLWGIGFIQATYGLTESYASYINSLLFMGAGIEFAICDILSIFTTNVNRILDVSYRYLSYFDLY